MKRFTLQQGFSMIEMVMTIVILGIIAGLAANMLAGGVNAYLTGEKVLENAPVARAAMERIVHELRHACDGTINISVDGNRIDFTRSSTPNCTTPSTRSIRLSGSTLELQVAGGDWNPLAKNVTQLEGNNVFGAITNAPGSNCRTLDVQFRITGDGGVTTPMRTGVYLRNYQCV